MREDESITADDYIQDRDALLTLEEGKSRNESRLGSSTVRAGQKKGKNGKERSKFSAKKQEKGQNKENEQIKDQPIKEAEKVEIPKYKVQVTVNYLLNLVKSY